jgi:hypothetical protein
MSASWSLQALTLAICSSVNPFNKSFFIPGSPFVCFSFALGLPQVCHTYENRPMMGVIGNRL